MTKPIDDLIEGFEERRDAFCEALDGQDDLGVVVRAHIHIEHELQHFVRVLAPVPEFVDFSKMDYDATLTLALILGLSKDLRSPLRALGSLRNKFSHRLKMSIGKSDAADIWSKLGAEGQRDLKATLAKIRHRYPERPQTIELMSPREWLALSCLHLYLHVAHEAVSAAAKQIKGFT